MFKRGQANWEPTLAMARNGTQSQGAAVVAAHRSKRFCQGVRACEAPDRGLPRCNARDISFETSEPADSRTLGLALRNLRSQQYYQVMIMCGRHIYKLCGATTCKYALLRVPFSARLRCSHRCSGRLVCLAHDGRANACCHCGTAQSYHVRNLHSCFPGLRSEGGTCSSSTKANPLQRMSPAPLFPHAGAQS